MFTITILDHVNMYSEITRKPCLTIQKDLIWQAGFIRLNRCRTTITLQGHMPGLGIQKKQQNIITGYLQDGKNILVRTM